MRILHTADLHLNENEEKRVDILKWLLKRAQDLNVELFIIAGDLFESDTDATVLRPKLKKIFEPANMQFLIIPGNHDAKSYGQNYDYGKNVVQLTQTPFEIVELDDLNIVGVPYQEKKFGECAINLPPNIDILITHGMLYDTSLIFSIPGSEMDKPYMPIYPANLENIARYVALGHIHSHTFSIMYQNTKVVYPGAPIAINTKCTGKRFVYFVNIDNTSLDVKPLEVEVAAYWEEKEFFVFPGIEDKILDDLNTYLASADTKNIMYNINIKGFIGESDKIFHTNLTKLNDKYTKEFLELRITPDNIQSWDKVMQNPLAKKFVEKTEGLTNELKNKLLEITLPIFSEMIK